MLSVKTKYVRWKAKQIVCLGPILLLIAACGDGDSRPAATEKAAQDTPRQAAAQKRFRALVFTKTTGFRHDSIPQGVAAIRQLGSDHDFAVDTTENAGRFTHRNLARYEVVIFLQTTGTPIRSGAQRAAFQRFIRRGGGYVGVHAASDTRGRWPWYERLVGTRFKRHDPGLSERIVNVVDRGTAATRGLPAGWTRTDEWYEFRSKPRAHVIAQLDESRPLAWCRRYDGGRSVYTAMGHTKESYSEPQFVQHLLGAIEMAAGRVRFACAR
jgi:type 1 glutamine amidotransferase